MSRSLLLNSGGFRISQKERKTIILSNFLEKKLNKNWAERRTFVPRVPLGSANILVAYSITTRGTFDFVYVKSNYFHFQIKYLFSGGST